MNKKPDFKNFRLQSFLSKQANSIMTLHPVRKEWRIAIVSLMILKLLTMFFSLFGGWSFFSAKFTTVFQNLDFAGIKATTIISTLSIITLIAIELLTAVFLQKMFKFYYRGRFITGLASMVVVGLFYSISFISSTNGLASQQANKADKTEEISTETQTAEQSAKTDLDSELLRLNNSIAVIERNPQGWSEGKRSYLTAKQLADISKIQDEIKVEKADYKANLEKIQLLQETALSKNSEKTQATAKDYYKIMTIVMALQFMATGFLVFFWYLIRSQESKDAVVGEDLREISDTVASHAESLIMNTLVDRSNMIHHAVNQRMQQAKYIDSGAMTADERKQLEQLIREKADKKEIGFELKNEKTEQTNEEKKPVKIVGFNSYKASHEKQPQNSHKTAQHLSQLKQSSNLSSRDLAYLNKHKLIVKSIKNNLIPTSEGISNQQINKVIESAPKAKFKSRSLVQNVFLSMVAVGFENIDKDGNLITK